MSETNVGTDQTSAALVKLERAFDKVLSEANSLKVSGDSDRAQKLLLDALDLTRKTHSAMLTEAFPDLVQPTSPPGPSRS
jgi:hypothetical protein